MEFNEKLQLLRKQNNMTQEQLAEKLFVSRTAVSKWESGKGYPNIESLKCISTLFSVSIDELLSSEELMDLAETENRSNLNRIYNIIFGVIDVLAVAFILLPLYGRLENGYIYSVNLLSYTDTKEIYMVINYWIVFVTMIGLGIAKIVFTYLDKEKWGDIVVKCSGVLNGLAVCFFAAAREPYATALIFLYFVIKMFIWIKQSEIKKQRR